MNEKRILALIMVVVLVSMLIGACAAPAPTPAPAPAPAPAPKPAPPALPEVNWTLGTEEASHDTWGLSPLGTMADKVSERTNGKFNIRVTIAGELGTSREEIPLIVSSGLIEMGLIPGGHVTGSIPHLGIYSLPFLVGGVEGVVPDAAKVEGATHKLTELKFGELGFATAFHYPSVPTELISKTVIEDVSDLDGLKVRAWSEATANIVKGLNGEPVIMSVSETYLALQRGVVDAVMTGVSSGMIPMSLQEVAKYLYLIDLAPAYIWIGYNIEAFEALPAEYQKILSEEWENAKQLTMELREVADGEAYKTMEAAGVEVISPSPEVMAIAAAKVRPQWEEWASTGPTCKEAYDAVMKAFGM